MTRCPQPFSTCPCASTAFIAGPNERLETPSATADGGYTTAANDPDRHTVVAPAPAPPLIPDRGERGTRAAAAKSDLRTVANLIGAREGSRS